MKSIINLTAEKPTERMLEHGLIEPRGQVKEEILELLDHGKQPSVYRAKQYDTDYALIDGPNWLTNPLYQYLYFIDIKPLHFSDGHIIKNDIEDLIKRL